MVEVVLPNEEILDVRVADLLDGVGRGRPHLSEAQNPNQYKIEQHFHDKAYGVAVEVQGDQNIHPAE